MHPYRPSVVGTGKKGQDRSVRVGLVLFLASLWVVPPSLARGDDQPIDVNADNLEMDRDNEGIVAKGNVHIIQTGEMELKADEAAYSGKTREVSAHGNIRLVQKGNLFKGERVVLNTSTRFGHMEQVDVDMAGEGGRGGAREVELLGPDNVSMNDAWFTQCDCDPPPWKFSADKIDIDRNENSLVANSVKFYVADTPVLWSPWWEQPVNNQRKSGFLIPDIRSGNSNGLEFEVPYYYNMAPDRDMTVALRSVARRGTMGKLQYRYLGLGYQGKIQTQQIDDEIKGTWRGLTTIDHKGRLWGWDMVARGEMSQTRDYINDYHQNLVESKARRLESYLVADRYGIRDDGYSDLRVGARWNQDLEAVDEQFTVQSLPFAVFADSQPLKSLRAGDLFDHLDGNRWRLQREFHLDHFYQTSGDAVQRFDAAPAVEYTRPVGVARLRLRGQLRETAYVIQGDPEQTGVEQDNTQHREASMVSIGLGSQLLKNYPGFATHTLEPRIEYSHNAATNQGLLPNYDATQRYFAFSNLFGDSLYSGLDRISVGHRVGYSLTSRLLGHGEDGSLWQYVDLGIGQRWAPEGSQEYQQGNDFSEVVSTLGIHLIGGWEIGATNRYDPYDQELENVAVRLARFQSRHDSIALGYYYNQPSPAAGALAENSGALLEDVVADSRIGLNDHWTWSQEASYSLLQTNIKSWKTGLAYEHQCWKLSIEGGRNLANDTQEHGGGFIGFSLGLKGIGDYGV